LQFRPGFDRAFAVSAQQTRNRAVEVARHPEENQMTQTENVASWRDLIDQLTPPEVSTLAAMERDNFTPHNLLVVARSSANNSLAVTMIGDVEPPAGASHVYEWDADTAAAHRLFDVASWEISDQIAVDVCGKQYPDGSTDLEIRVQAPDVISPADARRLGPALIKAADEMERLDRR
jgi:hypothetical protein